MGPPGIGKTRLALALAEAVAERFSQGASFIDLATVREPDLVLAGIGEGLGLPESADQPWQERLERVLEPQHRLLVLDNFEQVIAAAGVIAHLVSRCSELKLRFTSRAQVAVWAVREGLLAGSN